MRCGYIGKGYYRQEKAGSFCVLRKEFSKGETEIKRRVARGKIREVTNKIM